MSSAFRSTGGAPSAESPCSPNCLRAAPQSPQKLFCGGFWCPHEHFNGSATPHCPQKRWFSELRCPLAHVTAPGSTDSPRGCAYGSGGDSTSAAETPYCWGSRSSSTADCCDGAATPEVRGDRRESGACCVGPVSVLEFGGGQLGSMSFDVLGRGGCHVGSGASGVFG